MTRFDDSYAREKWGWNSEYTKIEAIVNQFQKDLQERPKLYGVP
jgi:hypothetical protein